MLLSPSALADARLLSWSNLAGAALWIALLFVPLAVSGPEAEAAHLLLLVPLVVAPVLLEVAAAPGPDGRNARPYRLAVRLQPAGALGAAAAFVAPTGPVAALLTLPWAAVTALVAVWGLVRLRARRRTGRLPADEAVLIAGLLLLPGGALWLSLSRLGADPGYGPLVVLLTAVHFHYAAFVAPVWAGLLGRALAERAPGFLPPYRVLGFGLVLGTPLVALGFAGSDAVETLGVLALTASAFGLGVLGLLLAPRFEDRFGALMLGVSAGALCLGMGWALAFNLGPRLGGAGPTIPEMIPRHGWVNGVGFALWGALAWRRLRPRPLPMG